MNFMRTMLSSIRRVVALSAIVALPASAQTFGTSAADNSALFGRDTDFAAFGALAQTFTAPVGAPVLTSFTFWLSNGFSGGEELRFIANVFAFNNNGITGDALYTSAEQVGSSNLEGFDAYMFSNVNVSLMSGVTYAMVLRPTAASPDFSTNLVGTTQGETFALGGLFLSTGTSENDLRVTDAFTQSTADTFGEDAAVTATFAERASTVPEPSSALLLVTGMGVVAVRLRRAIRGR